jgi:ATP-dependent exoDNAse (exonuclease V) beta subunit
MRKALTVYKASAGSGKTFTLATEYIKLLVKNPMNYRSILAVTFTNKATEEMKTRILSQLYGLWKRLSDSRKYTEKITAETGMDETFVSQRAGQALHMLLHNYNYFRVETIDTFFQSVLRNLARELDLTANLRIGLNDTQVEEEAVDQMIDSLKHSDVLLQWILKYIMENISDDRSWNIIGQVKQFGRTIFRDYYKESSDMLQEKMADSHFFEHYAKQLRSIRDDAQKVMKDIGNEFAEVLQTEQLVIDDFLYAKGGVAGFFLKLQEGVFDESIIGTRVVNAADDATKWCKKTHERAFDIQALADSVLMPMLHRAISEQPRQWRLYKSADLTLKHLNQLRLLGSIEQKVHELNEGANRFLLSDTQHLLHALIKGSDSPFIFEKIGTRLEHIMIDEFQDTSSVQWQNFKVLLEECMSHEQSENLIVGDVKQSIYRWRSGDWRLLNAIDKQFSNADSMLDIRSLDTNYRSARNIIDFNNAFFTEAAQQEYNSQKEENPNGAEQLRKAYADVVQQVPADKEPQGLVEVVLLTAKDYQETMLQQLTDTVQRLLDSGERQRNIAILVRINRLIPLIADHFAATMPQVSIVSDEAYRLDASPSVTLLVQALHLLTHPDDMLAKATLVKLYQKAVVGNNAADNELFLKDRQLDEMLPESFTANTTELQQLPLYELAERLYTIFQLHKLADQSAYVAAFYDQLTQFSQENSTDIDAFIDEWETTISSKTIQSDEIDGIRIISIHKSKGLEFDNVIIPFCDWRLEHADILWCQPREEPFSALPLAPIDYSEKQMRGTIYERDYLEEHLQNTVDNLNLLYVAFTRASRNLFVIGRRDAKNSRSTLIGQVLLQLALEGSTLEGENDSESPLVFSYGTLYTRQTADIRRQTSENVFLQPVMSRHIDIESFDNTTEFRQSNRSREFMQGNDEQENSSYIMTGSILHEVFSTIRTTDDIDQALADLENSGVLYDKELPRKKLTDMLRSRLENRQVAQWFTDQWQLFNECSILHTDDSGNVVEHRPDRVMTNGTETHVVDFKFGKPKAEYRQQVQEYMQLLTDMGMPGVRGFLWYVYSNKIEEVKA